MKNKFKNYKVDVTDLDWKTGQVKGFLGKEFIQLSNGGVKLVLIEPMAIYPVHIHPDKTEFAYVIDGNPEFFIDSQYFINLKTFELMFYNNLSVKMKFKQSIIFF